MNTKPSGLDAELGRTFEPLRTSFAVLALLLGLIASLHF